MNWPTCINGKWNCPTAPLSIGTGRVPLEVAQEAYKEYAAQFGTSQSFERLNERGGFGDTELSILLFHRIKRLEKALIQPSAQSPEANAS